LQKVELLQPWKVRRPSHKKTMVKPISINPNMLEMDNLWNIAFDDYEKGVDEGTSSLVGDDSDTRDAPMGDK
jgi:hypothetical protein